MFNKIQKKMVQYLQQFVVMAWISRFMTDVQDIERNDRDRETGKEKRYIGLEQSVKHETSMIL